MIEGCGFGVGWGGLFGIFRCSSYVVFKGRVVDWGSWEQKKWKFGMVFFSGESV